MKKSKTSCDLKSCFFCKHCLDEWLPAVETKRITFNLKKGELLFKEGEDVLGMYFIYNGTIKVHKSWGTEKELIVRFAKNGDIVGHRGLGIDSIYPVSATAIEDCTVCFITLDFFNASLKVNNDLLYKLMMFFAEELKVSERKMRDLAHMPVKGRVAQALLTLKERFGVTDKGLINIIITRQDLASFTGTAYETVYKILNEFIADNIIRVSEKSIAIVNEPELKQIIG